MDAYYISEKIKKYWMALVPKNSGEIMKSKSEVKVIVMTEYGYREVCGVYIEGDCIKLELKDE